MASLALPNLSRFARIRSEAPPLGLVTLTVMLGLIMAIIDSSIVNVAINNMAGSLGSTIDEVAWVATGYILAQVIVMPLNGWLTARFGRRNFYAACIAIFTIASLLCGTATNVWLLVFYRVIQGFGGGALQPTAQAILFESYPPNRRNSAMAIFGLGAMVGPAIGPVLGGVIVDNYNWPLIFFINIPIGIVAFVMTMLYIRDPAYIKRDASPIDFMSLGLMTAGLASLQYVLERGQREDWFSSSTIVILSVVCVVSLIAFVVRQLRSKNPLVDLSIFRSRSFSAGSFIGIISGFGLFGTALIFPLFFQNVLGFTATLTGLALLPGAIATAISMPIAARLSKWIEGRISIAIGLMLFAVGTWTMGDLNANAGMGDVFWPRIVQGFALGFLFVPLTTKTLAGISRARLANATGLYTLIRQLGGSLGIAILQLVLTRTQDQAYANLASSMTLSHPSVAKMIGTAPTVPPAMAMHLWGMVEANATMISYNFVIQLCAIVFVLSIPTVLLLSGKNPSNAEPEAPHVALE
jgi:DHA2 family multidrug resistance protein